MTKSICFKYLVYFSLRSNPRRASTTSRGRCAKNSISFSLACDSFPKMSLLKESRTVCKLPLG